MSRVLLPAVALAGVVVSIAFVVLGLPESTPAQSVMLELSSLPLSVATGAGVLLLSQRADRPGGPRSRIVLWGCTGLVTVGLVLMGWAYLAGPRGVVHTGQLLVWLGLLGALIMMIRRQPRRRFTQFHLAETGEAPDEVEDRIGD